jgi:hypothetical protein
MSRWSGALVLCATLGLVGCSSDPPGGPTDGPKAREASAVDHGGGDALPPGGDGPASDAVRTDTTVAAKDGVTKDGPAVKKDGPIVKKEGGVKPDSGKLDSGPPPPPPPTTCTAPITLADTTGSQVIGSGTPASCTAAALAAAVAKGGKITFNCGASPATITLTATLVVPPKVETVIDGGGKVTLDGGGAVRILEMVNPNYRVNTTKLVLQRLTFQNGKAPASGYVAPNPTNPKCAYGYKEGSGGAVYVRDAVLHVIDCVFKNNQAASPGPDVGGGAIYVLGSLGATIVGSTLSGNQGSNGGAVGLLQTTGTFVNVTLENNKATGVGQNYAGATGCPGVGHPEQGGAGGNGGAISIDGADDLEQSFCGVTFKGNTCNELGGCVFRTANGQQRKATFLRSTLDGNQAGAGGGCLYISNSDLTISQCLVANNTVVAGSGGGVRTELNTKASIVNTTFYGNVSTKGLMGALSHPGSGEIRNCTFAKNRSDGGPAYFTAALGPAGPVTVYNTVFLDNTSKDPWNPQACWFQPKSGANNFQWPQKRSDGKTDDTACVTGIVWADAKLGPLAANGGPTLSMLPLAGSPVIGAGASCPNVDQRGQPRSTTKCAAGAVEP